MGSWDVRGGHATVEPNGQPQSLLEVFVQGDSALPFTIVLGRADLDANQVDPTNTDAPIAARVRFGSARVADLVEVDVETGTSITVPWGQVEVTALYDIDKEPGAVRPTQRVQASAYVGARQGSVHPTRQVRLGPLEAGARVFVDVPAYAAEVALYGLRAANTYGHVDLRFCRASSGRELSEVTPVDATPVRIPNGTRSILVIANLTVLNLSLEFGLCL